MEFIVPLISLNLIENIIKTKRNDMKRVLLFVQSTSCLLCVRLEGHLWDDGHPLAQGVQTDTRSQKTIDYDSSLGLSQPEQGGDQGAFTGPSPPNDANLHPEKEMESFLLI